MKIDYSALSQPATKSDIENFKKSVAANPGLTSEKVASMIVFILMGGVMVFLLSTFFSISSSVGGLGLFPLVFVLPVVLGMVGYYLARGKRTENLVRLHKFAAANGIRFVHDRPDPAYPGVIFDNGYSRSINEALEFPNGTEIGNYEYTTGSGKKRRTHTWSYARVKLTRRLPHMVLDAKQNNFFSSLTTLPANFDTDQTLQLEGDFNNYFTLYAPKKYERDALYVFTPDVMAAVIDAGRAFDIEVVDDNLFLYSSEHQNLHSQEYLTMILGVIDRISTEIHDQTDYYADERVGDRAVNLIAEPGRRLTSNVSVVAIVIFVVFAILFLINFWRTFMGLLP